MSRLAALKEFTFMKALRENGFRVPEPIANNRHTIVMELIDAFPLRQISTVPDPAGLYTELIEMILRLAQYGLIHGDFNEFNILIKEDEVPSAEPKEKEKNLTSSVRLTPVLIDFPQMVSIDHANAEMYFDRDVNCIQRFFARRFHFTSDEPGPFFAEAKTGVGKVRGKRLDVEVEASGFSRKMAKDLEKYMQEFSVDGDEGNGRDEEDTLEDVDASEEERERVETPRGASQDSKHSEDIRIIGEEGNGPNTLKQLSVPISEVSRMCLSDT